MLGVQRVSPNEGENPRPRLLKIAFCSSRNKILTYSRCVRYSCWTGGEGIDQRSLSFVTAH